MKKKYLRHVIIRLMMDINSSPSIGDIQKDETVGEIFGTNPEKEYDLVMMLKLVDLVVELEHRLEIEIKDELSDIALMKLDDFVDYVFCMV